MYLRHFGLAEYPFSLTPDTSFFFDRGCHREAMNVLLVALDSGEGFIKVTGEVGLGKTMLCRKLLNSLGREYVTAFIPDPQLSAEAVHLAVADELGIDLGGVDSQRQVLQLIARRLIDLARHDRRVVLCLDETQQMPDESLEAVRLLTNLETEKRKLLQVVMFGQPELDRRLMSPAIRQLRQRITFTHRLLPLGRNAVDIYVRHRLRVAGRAEGTPFTSWAMRLLAARSYGTPRLINILAHKALMAAWGEGDTRVRRRHVRRAVSDTESVVRRPASRRRRVAVSLLSGLGAMAFLVGATLVPGVVG